MSKRLLVVDGDRARRDALVRSLTAHHHRGVAVTPQKAMSQTSLLAPEAIILTDEDPSLTTRLSLRFADAPVLFLDPAFSAARRLTALQAGVRDVLASDTAISLLLARLRGLLREADTVRESRRRVIAEGRTGFEASSAVFEGQRTIHAIGSNGATRRLLDALPHKVLHLTEEQALEPSDAKRLDAIIIPNARYAAALLPELRGRAHSRHAPVLAIYEPDELAAAVQALDLGAADVVPSDTSAAEIAVRLGEMLKRRDAEDALRRASEKSIKDAQTDQLTGLFNRRYAETYLKSTLLAEGAQDFTLMLADIDHFKRINDTYGHLAGDDVLVGVADRLKENLRAVDLIARFGGEEFLIVLPETSVDEAEAAADRLRETIGQERFPARGADAQLPVTLSIGVSVEPGGEVGDIAKRLEQRLAAADRALYKAKGAGRNRVSIE